MTLKEWLQKHLITTQSFAKKVGVSRSQIHKYMHEGAIPRYNILKRIYELPKKKVTANDFYDLDSDKSQTQEQR